jgi:hypothetical protein
MKEFMRCSPSARISAAPRAGSQPKTNLSVLVTAAAFSGMNFEGPAPRPLDRFQIMRGEDGQLVVGKSKIFRMEPSVEPDEQHPESVLKV